MLGAKTRLDELKAMRYVLACRVDDVGTSARDLAPLVRQLRDVSKEVEDLEVVVADRVVRSAVETDESFRLHMI